jgi:hypothetical protein
MADERFLYTGLIRLHVLHHVVQEPVYGLAMIEELGRPGTRSVRARSTRYCTGLRNAAI